MFELCQLEQFGRKKINKMEISSLTLGKRNTTLKPVIKKKAFFFLDKDPTRLERKAEILNYNKKQI